MTHPHPLVWRVVLTRTGEELGHVVASDYGTALGAAIQLAAKSSHPPQRIEVLRVLRCTCQYFRFPFRAREPEKCLRVPAKNCPEHRSN